VAPRIWDTVLSAAGPQPWGLIVAPSGRSLLGLLPRPSERASADEVYRLVLIDVATAQVIETGFAHTPRAQTLNYAMSADDQALAVALSDPMPGHENLTVTVLRGPDLERSIERTFPGCGMHRSAMDHLLQWSPDGRYLALQMRAPNLPVNGMIRLSGAYDSLHILDAQTLETVFSLRATWLMGSQSWSPQGDKLAVLDFHEPRILHMADQRLEQLPWLRGERGDPPRQPQILGLLAADRALVMRQNRKRVLLVIADVATGTGRVGANLPLGGEQGPIHLTISRAWERFTDVQGDEPARRG
jgi:hypothetical protein